MSTGRFQKSVLNYRSESLDIRIGRTNFFDEIYRASVFEPPINGDGFSWGYKYKNFAFKHVLESLPAEKSGAVVFRRLLSYHHLEYHFGRAVVGAGEYFLLSGNAIGLEFKRLNPFLPFSLNSHDSEADIYTGFSGDADNALINFFLTWAGNSTELRLRLYVDEFQIDSKDREVFSDAMLVNISVMKNLASIPGLNIPAKVEGTISLSNPNFGEHPGPFTTTTSGGYPLFEFSPGMLRLYFLKVQIQPSLNNVIWVSAHHEHWLNISSLPPDIRNKRAVLEILPVEEDYLFLLSFKREINKLHTQVEFQGWRSSESENSGILVSLRTLYPFQKNMLAPH